NAADAQYPHQPIARLIVQACSPSFQPGLRGFSGPIREFFAEPVQFADQRLHLLLVHGAGDLSGVVPVHGVGQIEGHHHFKGPVSQCPGADGEVKVLLKVTDVHIPDSSLQHFQPGAHALELVGQQAAVGILHHVSVLLVPGGPEHQPVSVVTGGVAAVRRKSIVHDIQPQAGLLIAEEHLGFSFSVVVMGGVKRVVVRQLLLQQGRGVQPIGTAGLAGVAVDAVFDLVHLLPPLVAQIGLVGCPPQQLGHPGRLGDVDA
ncbi:DNA repair protein RecO, partial [Dysosmobacter welbionis]